MTELDMEIQVLRRENERLIKERNAAIKELIEFSYCCNCESYNKDGKYTGVCNRDGEIYVGNHTCMLWDWRGVQNEV